MTRYAWPRTRAARRRDDAPGRAGFLAPRRTRLRPRRALEAPARGAAARRRAAAGPAALGAPRRPSGARTCGCRSARRRCSTARPRASRGSPAGSGRSPSTPTASGSTPPPANGGVWYSSDGGGSVEARSAGSPRPTRRTIARPAHRHACGAILVRLGARRRRPDDDASSSAPARPTSRSTARAGPHARRRRRCSSPPGRPTRRSPTTRGRARRRTCSARRGLPARRRARRRRPIVAATRRAVPAPGGAGQPTSTGTRVAGDAVRHLEGASPTCCGPRPRGGAPERLWAWATGDQAGALVAQRRRRTNSTRVTTPGARRKARGVAGRRRPADRGLRVQRPSARAPTPTLFRGRRDGAATADGRRVAGVPDVLATRASTTCRWRSTPTTPTGSCSAARYFEPPTDPAGQTQLPTRRGRDLVAAEVGRRRRARRSHAARPHDRHRRATPTSTTCGSPTPAPASGPAATAASSAATAPPSRSASSRATTGSPIIEAELRRLPSHLEGYVVAGLQDNGVIERALVRSVARTPATATAAASRFDPIDTTRYVRQYFHGRAGQTSAARAPLGRRRAARRPRDATQARGRRSAFYSTAAAIAHSRAGAAAPTTSARC